MLASALPSDQVSITIATRNRNSHPWAGSYIGLLATKEKKSFAESRYGPAILPMARSQSLVVWSDALPMAVAGLALSATRCTRFAADMEASYKGGQLPDVATNGLECSAACLLPSSRTAGGNRVDGVICLQPRHLHFAPTCPDRLINLVRDLFLSQWLPSRGAPLESRISEYYQKQLTIMKACQGRLDGR